ncbi:hypothetical protein Tdes44962_MAKER00337 [Teratosphaeria destructans]|uniref:Uncharacterized protein n=1 Tax=Teratosphaeria destructans TaxID=418781 RepID=A0A9W7SRV1_9PEZI|nr:hypothetical protein Tdes44962_MAKER00337 [Teratosphaeria destructans]
MACSTVKGPREEAMKSPLGRLPPEIRAHVYKYVIKTRVLFLRHCVAGSAGRNPPAVLLASKSFYGESKDYLLENQSLILCLDGASPNKTRSLERREKSGDVAARLGVVRDLLLKARNLRLIFRLEGPIVESARSMGLLLDWLKEVLELRKEPLQRLELDFRGHRWWYSRFDVGHREEDWLGVVSRGVGQGPLPCDPLLTASSQIRCAVLSSKFTIVGKGAISDAAYDRFVQSCEGTLESKAPPATCATRHAEQDALRKVINAYWRQASFFARLTNGETENLLRVYRFGDRDDKRAYASSAMTKVKQYVHGLVSEQ